MADPRTFTIRSPLMRGDDIKAWQRELRQQFDGMNIDYEIKVDGVYGEATRDATETLLYALGIAQSALDHGLTPWLRVKIRDRQLNTAELRRMKERTGWRRRLRKKHAKPKASQPQAALAFLRKYIGKTENPAGSNRAPWGLTDWQSDFGSYLVGAAWCGVAAGTALKHAGVKGINARVASVALILDDALNGRNGFRSCVFRRRTGRGSLSAARPGDVAGLFGEGTHTGIIEKRVPGGFVLLEGNTSPGNSGSQANGGGVWRRTRPDSAVVFIARPNYGD